MTTQPPQSIPTSQFKPRFDTSTLDGKIAVMQEFKRVEYAYTPAVNGMSWALITKPHWDWDNLTFNFPTEPRTKIVPFTRDTFPREAWIRYKVDPDYNFRVLSFSSDSFRVDDTIEKYTDAIVKCEISLDNGKTWTACGQVVEE